MPISGKFLQFNIGSAVSFQFKAGFASASHGELRSEDQLNLRRKEELEESRVRSVEATRHEEAYFYEVVEPQKDESFILERKVAPATIALPARAIEEAALVPAESSSDNGRIVEFHQRGAGVRQDSANGKGGYIQSYNRKGQRMSAMLKPPMIDLFI